MFRATRLSRYITAWLILPGLLLSACGDTSPAPAATTAPATAALTTTAATAAPATAPVTTAATGAVNTTAAATTAASLAPAATGQPGTTVNTAAPWVKDGACYQVFVRSFFDSNGDGNGDIAGLISKLDYLNDGKPGSTRSLNVNCAWLMPVQASPSYHGYDTTDYYKINPDYGSNEDFKRLVQEAHKRGINVLIDLVLNHTSKDHPWFKEAAANPQSPYRNYYIFSPTDPGYRGPDGQQVWFKNPNGTDYYYAIFGAGLPDLNYANPAVTKEMYEVTRFWLQDMGVDGFRLDAVKFLIEEGQRQVDTAATHNWLRAFRRFYTSVKPTAFTIGEVYTPTPLNSFYPDQLDYYFEFTLAKSLIINAKNGRSSFVGLYKDANKNWPDQRYGTFLTNHDQTRVMTNLEADQAKMKLAAAAYLTLPGLPFIYYGEEIGMEGAKGNGENGDLEQRTPLQWTADPATGGFTTGKPWQPLNQKTGSVNIQAQDSAPDSLLNLYRRLVQVRRANPGLGQGDFQPLSSSTSSVGAYLRHSGSNDVLVVLNMSDEAVTDLKLGLDSSSLAPGTYTPGELFTLNNAGMAFAPLAVGPNGAVTDYAPLANLPAHSAYIVVLKK